MTVHTVTVTVPFTIRCLVGAILLEQNDGWAAQRARYMTLVTINQMSDDPPCSLPAVAR